MTVRLPSTSIVAVAALLLAGCAGRQRSEVDATRRVRLGIAESMAERGEWSATLEGANALTRDDPSDMAVRILRARALRHLGMLSEAESDLEGVLAREPRNAAAHAELGVVCELAGKVAEALPHHREAHRLAPRDPRYLNNLAFALTLRGKEREAIPLLEEALRIDPGNARMRNNLGFAYAAKGDFMRATQQFHLGGAPAQAKNNLGLAYELKGNLTQAYELYLEAWRLEPAPTTRDNLVHVAQKLGRSVPPEVTAARDAEKEGGS
jgi:Flp pilus assembly protein TadD